MRLPYTSLTMPKLAHTETGISHSKKWLSWLLIVVYLLSGGVAYADTLTQSDIYQMGINYYDIAESGGSCGGQGDTTLTGNDNVQKIFNYFIAKGLSAAAAAGIMGNMQAESRFNPAAEQVPGSWEDMSDEFFHAVGLVQWDGGRRPAMIKYAESQGLTVQDLKTASDKSLGVELDYVWQELTTNYKTSTLVPLQAATKPDDAAFIFHQNYEGSADSREKIQGRMNNAIAIFNTYGGSTTGASSTSTAAGGGCSSFSPNCTSAQGVAKILCAAKAYDTVSYFEGAAGGHLGSAAAWHKTCPIIGPSCVLDCSGLVNIAVYDAFGVELNENTDSERADIGKYWKEIPVGQLQPGDIMQPNTGHVEIVDHIQGNTLYTFGAHTDSYPQPKQVGPASRPLDSSQLYLHYIGPGV